MSNLGPPPPRRRMADLVALLRARCESPWLLFEQVFQELEAGVLAGNVLEANDETGDLLEVAPFIVKAHYQGRLREALWQAMAGPTAPVLVTRRPFV